MVFLSKIITWSMYIFLTFDIISPEGVAGNAKSNTESTEFHGDEENDKAWTASKVMISKFPYFVSGFDNEKRPVFIVEMGKWPIREYVERGGEDLVEFSKYLEQMIGRMELGPRAFFHENNMGANGIAVIMDWEDFSLQQFLHGPTTQFILKHFTLFQKIQNTLAYGYFVNANPFAQQLLNMARPMLGSVMERAEIFGTQKEKWVHKILRNIPRSQLPPEYGGYNASDFQPVIVYG